MQKKADVEMNVLICVKSSLKLTEISDIRLSVMQQRANFLKYKEWHTKMWNGFSDELHCKLDVRNTKCGGWGRERFVHLENGHFASITNVKNYIFRDLLKLKIKQYYSWK